MSSACSAIRIFQFHETLRSRSVVVIIGAGWQLGGSAAKVSSTREERKPGGIVALEDRVPTFLLNRTRILFKYNPSFSLLTTVF